MYYVYVLQQTGEGDSLYLGYTSDLRRRLKEHNRGANASTAGRQWKLVYYEAYTAEQAAREREASLKRNRRMKQFLIERIRKGLQ